MCVSVLVRLWSKVVWLVVGEGKVIIRSIIKSFKVVEEIVVGRFLKVLEITRIV